jgi:hypothetical protein
MIQNARCGTYQGIAGDWALERKTVAVSVGLVALALAVGGCSPSAGLQVKAAVARVTPWSVQSTAAPTSSPTPQVATSSSTPTQSAVTVAPSSPAVTTNEASPSTGSSSAGGTVPGDGGKLLAACWGTDGYGNAEFMVTADTLQECEQFVSNLAAFPHDGTLTGGATALVRQSPVGF